MEELKIQDGGCSPFLCCSRDCASLSVALRLLFTQTDGSVFALEAASPSNWLSLSPQVAEEAVQVCVCEELVSFSVWAWSLSHTARWLRLFKVWQRLGGALVSVWVNNITYSWLPSSLVVDRWICTQELQRKMHAESIYTLDYNCILCSKSSDDLPLLQNAIHLVSPFPQHDDSTKQGSYHIANNVSVSQRAGCQATTFKGNCETLKEIVKGIKHGFGWQYFTAGQAN